MKKLLFCVVFISFNTVLYAQIVNGNAFLKGQFVEVGMNQCGGWGTTADAPAGYHARSGNTNTMPGNSQLNLGFVADPDKDGWTTGTPTKYNGDYFLPVSPWVGWGISFNNLHFGTDRTNTTNTTCANMRILPPFTGSVVSVTSNPQQMQAIWRGTNNGLELNKIVTVKTDKVYFTVKILLKNTGAAPITNIYYGEYVNPDNDYYYHDLINNSMGLDTKNSIVQQNPADNQALVESLGRLTQSYLGLGSKDCRAKVYRARNFVADPQGSVANWYINPTTPNTNILQTGADGNYLNGFIGIGFSAGTLAPGDSTSFTFSYILKSTDFNEALAETETLVEHATDLYNSGSTIYGCAGTPMSLSLVNAADYTWAWSNSGGALSGNTGITNSVTPGTTPSTLTINGTSASCGAKQLTFTVSPANATIVAPTLVQPTCPAPTGTITVNATGIGPLEYSIDNGITWQNSNVFSGLSIAQYNIVVRNTTAPLCTTAYSGNPVVIANSSLPAVTVPADQTACNGSPVAAISLIGSAVAGTVYNWVNDNPAIGLAASGTGNIASFTAINTGTAPVTATISVTPASGNCIGVPEQFTITINPTPAVNNVNAQTLCNGQATTAVNFNGPVAGTVYNWVNDNPAIGLAASGTGNIASFTAVNTGATAATATITVTPVYTNGTIPCNGSPVSFQVNVHPTPSVNNVNAQTLCNGEATAAVSFSGPVAGTVYNWTNSHPLIGLPASGTGNIASFTAVNTGTAPVTATIRVTPVSGNTVSCNGAASSFTITVNPAAVVNAVNDQALCTGTHTTAIYFTGGAAGTQYNWTNDQPGIGLGASGTGNIAAFTAINNGNTVVTANITVAPVNNTCPGASNSFEIVVYAAPKLGADKTIMVCSDASADLTTAFPVTGLTTAWTKANVPVPDPAAVNTGSYQLIATNANGCSDTASAAVQMYPAINLQVIASPAATSIMEGQPVQLSSMGTGITRYSWSPTTGLSTATASTTTAIPPVSIRYLLSVENAGGCTDTAGISFKVMPLDITASAAFTPNGDGFTDKWIVKNIEYARTARVLIFNRWGNKVYESNQYKNDWDGRYRGSPLPDGAYYYQLHIVTAGNKTIDRSGSITLVR